MYEIVIHFEAKRSYRSKSDFVFWCAQWSTVDQKVSKNKNWPILMKFGMCIVWSRLIVKSKKNFEKIHFLDRFLSWSAHCARSQSEILIFFSKFQNIYMLEISKWSEMALDMFSLLSEPENEGYSYTHVHCAQTKYILANEPSPQRCSMVQVS